MDRIKLQRGETAVATPPDNKAVNRIKNAENALRISPIWKREGYQVFNSEKTIGYANSISDAGDIVRDHNTAIQKIQEALENEDGDEY